MFNNPKNAEEKEWNQYMKWDKRTKKFERYWLRQINIRKEITEAYRRRWEKTWSKTGMKKD